MLEFLQWLQLTGWATALRSSHYVYPLVLWLHVIGIGMFGGAILVTDLRLLGMILRNTSAASVISSLRPVKHIGMTLVAICGISMFASKAEEYYYNVFFHIKVGLFLLVILHAFAFRSSVYRAAEPGKNARLAAIVSIILWVCLIIAGRAIGYVEAPFDKIHASI